MRVLLIREMQEIGAVQVARFVVIFVVPQVPPITALPTQSKNIEVVKLHG